MIAKSGIRMNGMASSLCVQRIAMVNSLPTPLFQAVDQNEQAGNRKQDAGNRYNTVRDSCQYGMALDVFSNHGGPLYSAFSLRSCSAASFLASRRYSSPRLR
mgnify:CR=1 FL=1